MEAAGAELLPAGVRVQDSAGAYSNQGLEGSYVQEAAGAAAVAAAARTYNSVPVCLVAKEPATRQPPPQPAAAAGAGRVVEQGPPAAVAIQEIILASELQPEELKSSSTGQEEATLLPSAHRCTHKGPTNPNLNLPPSKRSRKFVSRKGIVPKPLPRKPARSYSIASLGCLDVELGRFTSSSRLCLMIL
jgi:hypothetical protein